MATAQSVIKDFMQSLDNTNQKSTNALDNAVKSVSKFSSWSELKETMLSDISAYNGNYTGFLNDMCGIILDNDDTGAITGSDAGGGSTKNAESIVPESGSWNYPTSNSFTIQGLTVKVPDKSSLTESQQFIVGGLYSWWINSSLTLINDSFGMNFLESGTSVKEINLIFYDGTSGSMAAVEYDDGQKSTKLNLKINNYYYSNIDTSDPNGVGNSSALTYLDRTIAHEMVHAVMAANVDYFNSLPTVFKEGVAELVHGIDDKRYKNIVDVAKSSSTMQTALSGSSGNSYAAGYILLRYLAKQAAAGRSPETKISVSDTSTASTTTTTSTTTKTSSTTKTTATTSTTTKTTSTTSTVVSASASLSGSTLTVKGAYAKNVLLSDYPSAVTLDASKMTTSKILVGNSNDNKIIAGTGNETLWGGAGGNDTLQGNSGRDMFWYMLGNGNDVATNFTSGTGSTADVVNIQGGNLKSYNRTSGKINFVMNDAAVFSVSTGSDVDTAIKYSTNSQNISNIKIGNTNSSNNFTYDSVTNYYLGGNSTDTLSVTGSGTVVISDNKFNSIEVLSAKNSSGQNILVGNSSNNSIIAGSGNSSLWGGSSSSNDTLIGGSGTDMFWYGRGEGNDVITNSNQNDSVIFYNLGLGDITGASYTKNSVTLAFNTGRTITVNDSGGVSATMKFSDGQKWKYNHSNNSWQQG